MRYCIAGDFRQKKIFANLLPAFVGENLSANFSLCNILVKINSVKYFYNTKVAS